MTDDEHPTTPDAAGERDPVARHFFPQAPAAVPDDPLPVPLLTSSSPTAPPPTSPPPGTPTGPSGQPAPPASPAPKRPSWGRWIVWASLAVLVLAIFVSSRINLDYYAIQPGTAQSVQPFIKVPAAKSHPVTRPVLLTDVQEARVTALNYLFFKLQSNTALYSVPAVTGGTAPSELDAQGALQMSQAEASAKTAALRHLGYTVTATPSGAVIAGTFPGTPAHGVLNVGDVVTAVDGKATPTALALTQVLAPHHPGQTVTFTVRKGGTGAPGPVSLTLKRTKVELDGRTVTLDVGILPQDQVDYTYPFPISIDVTDIGGPSAGLAMTLGVIDALSGGKLTGGHTVAATGTMDAQGNVGDVGGVPQKTVAVENARATIFLVPPGEYADAKSKQRSDLKIYPVSTLDQALRVLAANGGQVPTAALVASTSNGAG
ncbi:MAG TPA: S16 family serine protease [Acidimicrobiales bacterium]